MKQRVPQVVVVIPNWNGADLLRVCLRSLRAQEFAAFAVVVVDNGSTDGSVALVGGEFPQVHLIENPDNRGFAAATNQGIAALECEYVATLNNDTEVEPGWLRALVQAMASDPRVGMCASRIELAGQPGVIDSAGIAVDRAGIAWGLRGGVAETGEASAPSEVFGPSAGAALYRRAMLDEIGLFDEDFFAYLEDVDLAWRAQWAGWKCLYVPQASVRHVHSATARRDEGDKRRLLGRNKIWTVCKNYPFPHSIWYALPILIYDLLAAAYAACIERRPSAVRGRVEALGGMARMLRKRRRRVRRVSASEMMRRLRPLEWPWRILRRYAHVRAPNAR